MKSPIIEEVEYSTYEDAKCLEVGGYLEMKDGEECLRLADAMENVPPRTVGAWSGVRITKQWQRPQGRAFSKELYPVR